MAFLVRLRVEPLERIDLGDDRRADLSRCQDLADAMDDRIEVPIVGDAQRDAACRARRDDAVALGNVHGHGLLAEDVLPGFRRGNGLGSAWNRTGVAM